MPEIISTYTGVVASVKSSSGVTNVKDCKNEDVNSLMVESRLNIFHSKFLTGAFSAIRTRGFLA